VRNLANEGVNIANTAIVDASNAQNTANSAITTGNTAYGLAAEADQKANNNATAISQRVDFSTFEAFTQRTDTSVLQNATSIANVTNCVTPFTGDLVVNFVKQDTETDEYGCKFDQNDGVKQKTLDVTPNTYWEIDGNTLDNGTVDYALMYSNGLVDQGSALGFTVNHAGLYQVTYTVSVKVTGGSSIVKAHILKDYDSAGASAQAFGTNTQFIPMATTTILNLAVGSRVSGGISADKGSIHMAIQNANLCMTRLRRNTNYNPPPPGANF
jgi:hypothetical protein